MSPTAVEHGPGNWSRRRVLRAGFASLGCAAIAGFALVDRGVLPGRRVLDELDGACAVSGPTVSFAAAGPSISGRFASQARGRSVGYTVAYPPGHGPGSRLALVIVLHGFGGNHGAALSGGPLAHALAARTGGRMPAPMALVAADGGDGYWNPHPGDDPMAMVVSELLPICKALGLGLGQAKIGALGISMGGYGALLLAERHPELLTAVAAISPAIWTTYAQARAANAGAYASARAFEEDDVIGHAARLGRLPVRVASGTSDPFHPGVEALVKRLPASAVVELGSGCHDAAYFESQQPASLAFLGEHLR